jgi:diphthamide synthase (EF-2-diphthine--ammonia ligase)
MKAIIWVSGKQNAQATLSWAQDKKHEVVCFATMEPGEESLAWASGNMNDVKQASDTNKIDLIFKAVKTSGTENFTALDALLKFAKTKYKAEAVIVSRDPAIAHPIRNSAKKVNIKAILLPK